MAITWVAPKPTDLSTLPESIYWTQPLTVAGNTGPVSFSVVSGNLPPGVVLNRPAGRLEGVPTVGNLVTDIQDFTIDSLANIGKDVSIPYRFTIRAQDDLNVIDRSYSLTISNIIPPVIYPRATTSRQYNLGVYPDGTIFNIQLYAMEATPSAILTWKLSGGSLPNGLTLNEVNGTISGILLPVPSLDDNAGAGWDHSRWQFYPWDFPGQRIGAVFTFEITVYDGENYDTTSYSIGVYPLGFSLTADNDLVKADNDIITVDLAIDAGSTELLHKPVLLNTNDSLPNARQLSHYAYKFNAIDLDQSIDATVISDGSLTYELTPIGGSLPLVLDPATGWLYGAFPSQTEEQLSYIFSIRVYKTTNPIYSSTPKIFSLTSYAELSPLMEWETSANLGIIENGAVSQFSVIAKAIPPVFTSSSPIVTSISYAFGYGTLPPGLEVQSNGLITGRFTFDYFRLDGGSTTIDGGQTSFDLTYTFNIIATGYDSGNVPVKQIYRTFTIVANPLNLSSYDDVYLRAHPTLNQRNQFADIVDGVFSQSDAANLIYRPSDPHFGIATSIKSLFLPGLTPSETSAYAEAMQTNHYTKRFMFGDIGTAVALDSKFEPQYEVVYIELLDDMINIDRQSPNPVQDLTDKIRVGYMVNDDEYKIAYPTTYNIMKQLIAARTGYTKKGALPGWMTSRQPDGRVLGFTQAVVLCYLKPSDNKRNAERIARRFREYIYDQNISFNDIEFVADRYILDKNLESYPDMEDKYLKFPRLGVFI